MKTEKKLGIYMDHSMANLIEYTNEAIEVNNINIDFSFQDKKESLEKSESLMHNKEQQKQGAFYKNLSQKIIDYDWVILFGSTNAKTEFFNIVNEDHHFSKVKIRIKNTDKMTKNQQTEFVNNYFFNEENEKL